MILQDILENSMENKYFTPDIEDIRVGYEYEQHFETEDWQPSVYSETHANLFNFKCWIKLGRIRVPYLTKEQIEVEGWEYQTTNKIRNWYEIESPENGGNWYGYYIYKAQLIHDSEMKYVKISFCFDCANWETVFEGECKDINTLRSVMKLLRMKIKG